MLHENVVAIHRVSEAKGLPYLVMPYMPGDSLQKRLDEQGPLQLNEILRIGMQIAAGLAAAHAPRTRPPRHQAGQHSAGHGRRAGHDHRFRPGPGGGRRQPDAIRRDRRHAAVHVARTGAGRAGRQRSDLFSLGSVLYAMCTGRAPFRAETSYGVLRRITDEEPRPIREINPDIPEWLCGIIAKLMSKRPDDRFDSAHEVAELLEECLSHVQQPTSVPLPAAIPLPATRRSSRLRKILWKGIYHYARDLRNCSVGHVLDASHRPARHRRQVVERGMRAKSSSRRPRRESTPAPIASTVGKEPGKIRT